MLGVHEAAMACGAAVSDDLKAFRKQIREAIADYMRSEGCDCCRHSSHGKHAERIAKLLRVPKYADSSGFDFQRFRSKE